MALRAPSLGASPTRRWPLGPRRTQANPWRPWASDACSRSYTYSTNANQADIDIIADSIGGTNGNVLVPMPTGREEDTVSFLLGPTAVRYTTLGSSSFDALNGSISYSRLLGRRQTMDGYNAGGTATTDILTLGLDGTSVYEPGFGAEQISIATPSVAGRAPISGSATGCAAPRAARPIAISPMSR